MKRRLLTIALSLSLLVAFVVPSGLALAAASDTVDIKALPTFIAIAVTQTEKDFGAVVPSTNYATTADFFEIANTSNVATVISIWGSAFTGGGGWTLATDGAAAGSDTAGMYCGIVSGTWDIVIKASAGNTLIASLASSTNDSFHVKLYTPLAAFADGTEKVSTVTVSGVAE